MPPTNPEPRYTIFARRRGPWKALTSPISMESAFRYVAEYWRLFAQVEWRLVEYLPPVANGRPRTAA